MAWFEPGFFDFFKQLAANNHKDWFHDHRKEYETYVREPMKAFTSHMIDKFSTLEPSVKDLRTHKAIFRINNDIRFNPDKPLYKIHTAAAIAPKGTSNSETPGFYYHFGPDRGFMAGGSYQPSTEGLYKIRMAIMQQPKHFHKLIEDRNAFGGLSESEKHKRLPSEFTEAAEDWPILYNKQFYYMTDFDPEKILEDNLDQWMFNQYLAAEEVREFLRKALK